MPNPWNEINETIDKGEKFRKRSSRNWKEDRCPVCFGRAMLASKDPLNARHCEIGHIWRRGKTGSYIMIHPTEIPLEPTKIIYPSEQQWPE